VLSYTRLSKNGYLIYLNVVQSLRLRIFLGIPKTAIDPKMFKN
jgi:hypothetical protein